MDETGIRYTKRGDLHIGYQVRGEGPIDLLALNSGCNVWIDREDEVHWRRFDQRLACFSRLIRFDPRGVGLSDPPPPGSPLTTEDWAQDALAVLDAVESTRAAVLAVGVGGPIALLLCATQPERISSLVLVHCSARLARDADYPIGFPQEVLDEFVNSVTDPNFEGEPVDDLGLSAPSLANDPEFLEWWRRAGERSASPSIARAMDLASIDADVRSLLPLITTPTLVLHRVRNPLIPASHSRYLAEHIEGARLIELPGRDHLPFIGETDSVLGAIEEFLTGSSGARSVDRVLATVLFTDIVASTEHAAWSGDRGWRELLDDFDVVVGRHLHRFDGQQVKSTGDGILATFGGPAQAIHCGLALRDSARQLGVEVRTGVHTGEVERRGDDIAGIGVHISARVQACADPGEVWVSRTVTELVAGSGISFSDRGERALKGVPGAWHLFSVDEESGSVHGIE